MVVVESKDAQAVSDSLNSSNLSDNRSGTLHALSLPRPALNLASSGALPTLPDDQQLADLF